MNWQISQDKLEEATLWLKVPDIYRTQQFSKIYIFPANLQQYPRILHPVWEM